MPRTGPRLVTVWLIWTTASASERREVLGAVQTRQKSARVGEAAPDHDEPSSLVSEVEAWHDCRTGR